MSTPTASPYTGSCHCKAIKYSVNLPSDPTTWEPSRCNCTICHKIGYLAIHPTDVKSFSLLSPSSLDAAEIGDYTFGKKNGHHFFCKTCGVSVFGKGYAAELGGDMLLINMHTLDGVDLSGITVGKYWDGLNNNWAEGPKKEPVAPGCR